MRWLRPVWWLSLAGFLLPALTLTTAHPTNVVRVFRDGEQLAVITPIAEPEIRAVELYGNWQGDGIPSGTVDYVHAAARSGSAILIAHGVRDAERSRLFMV